MATDGTGETTPHGSPGGLESGRVGLLGTVARVAMAPGAAGSVVFLLRAGRNTPRFLLALFVIWVLSPFAALAWASMVSKRWAVPTRTALHCVALVITLGSLATYAGLFPPPAGSRPAFVFVAAPPGSWLLMAIVVPTVAWISRRRRRQQLGA